MLSLGNFRSVSQVTPWKQQHYCSDHFRGPKGVPRQRPQTKKRKNASRIAVRAQVPYDFSVTSQRESFSSSSRVRLTRNSSPASRRSALPFARSNSNRTGRRPGELARRLRTSRTSSPIVSEEHCKNNAHSWSVYP